MPHTIYNPISKDLEDIDNVDTDYDLSVMGEGDVDNLDDNEMTTANFLITYLKRQETQHKFTCIEW